MDAERSETIKARLKTLQELTEFTENCKAKLKELLDTFGWDQENENNSKEAVAVCPFDPNHRIPTRSMETHKIICQLSQMGYSKEEQAELLNPSFCYERASIPGVIIDKNTQHEVIRSTRAKAPLVKMEGQYSQGDFSKDAVDVPQSHKRALCDLTAADRLALYDHMVQETQSQLRADAEGAATGNEDLYVDLVAKLKKDDGQSGPKSHLEVLAEMRDYKRRRQSYRAKNVHITKKSYTEVIREVIDVHSEELSKLWQEEEPEEEQEEEREQRAARASRHSSHRARRRTEERRSSSVESRRSQASSRGRERDSSHRHGHSSRRKRQRSRDRSREHSRERSQERSRDRSRERSPERSREENQDQTHVEVKLEEQEQQQQQQQEEEEEEEKEEGEELEEEDGKGTRDSHSPDERRRRHHHHKKKKKKKKKKE
ncbi:U11/U12 small nuclear ribonucleoprotein 48 kDa protein isoform X2 [Engraulis encrasicolus]|uniref:U11/U12 small nuclear ribonucleoprotein 48 kDa protein isoform X2 n=1 Tax=Engraulis encrasicolus TaxID=184585 RepID=UPI002FD2DA8F